MYLLRKRWVARSGDKAPHDVGETDERERPAGHGRRQTAQVHFARQVGHQKRDVKTAREEAGMEQQIAAVAHGVADGLHRRRARGAGRRAAAARASDHAHQGQGGERDRRERPQRAHPAEHLDQPLRERREDELAERAAGIDDARRLASLLGARCAAPRRRAAPRSCRPPRRWPRLSPSDTMRPNPEVMNGVNAVPSASSTTPAIRTPAGPWRSATAPATGWIAPHTNCPTASARLIVVMPSAVELLSGEMNSPSDCRAPLGHHQDRRGREGHEPGAVRTACRRSHSRVPVHADVMVALYDGHHVSCQASSIVCEERR